MISFLRGKVSYKLKNKIILELNNLGYSVFIGDNFLNDLKIGEEAEIFTYQHIKEDIFDLYGFKTLEELEFFELLLSVSGIGPKSALGVLSMAKLGDIKQSIIAGDSNLLTKVSGIGKKTAERVVLELKDKLFKLGVSKLSLDDCFFSDEIEALVGLGYSWQESRLALSKVDINIKDSRERIKEALKKMTK